MHVICPSFLLTHPPTHSSLPSPHRQGLPDEWKTVLQCSGITRDEVRENPQQVLDVLQFHMQGPPPKMPSRSTLKRDVVKAINIIMDVNPNTIYKRVKKLGEGASGVVYVGEGERSSGIEMNTPRKSCILWGK